MKSVDRLYGIRNRFGADPVSEKIELLARLSASPIKAGPALKKLHAALCCLAAFPDNAQVHAAALDGLDKFSSRVKGKVRRSLSNTGIVGTMLDETYEYDEARWLDEHYGSSASIQWPDFENPERLDEALAPCLLPAEEAAFEEGEVSTREWMDAAGGCSQRTDHGWLLDRLEGSVGDARMRARLYEQAEIPVRWNLSQSSASITLNRLSEVKPFYRSAGMRRATGSAARAIARPTRSVKLLSIKRAKKVIDVAMAALLARGRSVYAITYGSPQEVYWADLGAGVGLAVIGVPPEKRFSLEGHYGYMAFSNGVPIAYGGASPLFGQINTGLNLFPEYRGTEAAFLFVEILRAFRSLFLYRHAYADAYQIGGEGNMEALRSGAFWLYYRLGFRPVESEIRKIASKEFERLRRGKGRRSSVATLKKLSECGVKLTLPVSGPAFFPENRLVGISLAATKAIAGRRDSYRGRDALAPIIAAIPETARWTSAQKRALSALRRAKGKSRELEFVRLARLHSRLIQALASIPI